MKIIPTDFPIFFGGTSDPFKNIIKLSSFAAHVLENFRAMPINLEKKRIQHSGIKSFVGLNDNIGVFGALGNQALFWSTEEETSTFGYLFKAETWFDSFAQNNSGKTSGFSIRCLKD